jgi:hypothetical protein
VTATADTSHGNDTPPFWGRDSTPFSATGDPPQPCRIVLRQVDDNDFRLTEALVLTPPDDMPGRPAAPLVIQPDWLTSDLASIPGVVGWFARRHGRHTPAALVHDFLITGKGERPPPGLPADWVLEPEQADLLFREMLLASGVPPVRSYLMWAAVAARTRWKTRPVRRLALMAWGVAAALGTFALVVGLAQQRWWLAAVAAVAPVGASALWGSQFLAGLIAGYAVWWALIGAVPAWIAYKLYQGLEGAVWLVRRRHHRRRPAGAGAPSVGDPPAPVSFDER